MNKAVEPDLLGVKDLPIGILLKKESDLIVCAPVKSQGVIFCLFK